MELAEKMRRVTCVPVSLVGQGLIVIKVSEVTAIPVKHPKTKLISYCHIIVFLNSRHITTLKKSVLRCE